MWFYKEDWERLQALVGTTTGVARAIRIIVAKTLDNIDAKAEVSSSRPKELTSDDLRNIDPDDGDE
jgi:hypothetical protein